MIAVRADGDVLIAERGIAAAENRDDVVGLDGLLLVGVAPGDGGAFAAGGGLCDIAQPKNLRGGGARDVEIAREFGANGGGLVEHHRCAGERFAKLGLHQVEIGHDDCRGLGEALLRLELDHRGILCGDTNNHRLAGDSVAAEEIGGTPDASEDDRGVGDGASARALIAREVIDVGYETLAAGGDGGGSGVEDGGDEIDALEEGAIIAGGLEAHLAEFFGDVARGLAMIFGAGETAAHGVGGVGLEPRAHGGGGHRGREVGGEGVARGARGALREEILRANERETGGREQGGAGDSEHHILKGKRAGQAPQRIYNRTTCVLAGLPHARPYAGGAGKCHLAGT